MRVSLLGVLGLVVASAFPAAGQGLFAEAPSAPASASASLGVVRSRPVRARLRLLPGASARDARLGRRPPRGHRLALNLFDDVVVRARMTRSERQGNAFVWVGMIEDQPLGDVVLTVYDGILTGSITWPGGAYRIAVEGGETIVQELDHSLFPEDGCFKEVPEGALDLAAEAVTQAEDGSLIDVLVVYTPAARSAAGGAPQIQATINTAIAETNTGYANSGVVQRLRLAAAVEVDYVENGDIRVDLDRITATNDGIMDDVHALRDTYKADVVSLITQTAGSPYCGVAWLMPGNNPGFAPNAFSVVERGCATGYYSFGHELGHNMGLNHARQDPIGPGAYPYSYGYKWTGYRTVMAYAPGTRILYFSNPNVLYGGSPTGVSEAQPTTSAHNALSLNNTRVTVANWRVNLNPTVTLTSPNGGQSWPAGAARSITWTSADLPAGAKVRISYGDGSRRDWIASRPAGGGIAVVPASQGSYSWTVPSTPGGSWRVSLCVPGTPTARGVPSPCLASDTSDAPFTITP